MRKLEIGAGGYFKGSDYEQLDSRPLPGVDHVCDAGKELPFPANTFDEVYSSQTLEHFSYLVTNNIINNWHRVVKPGGRLILDLPDIKGMIDDYEEGRNDWDHFVHRLYGGQDYEGNTHYTMFTLTEFLVKLDRMGLKYENYYRQHNNGGFHVEILK